MPYQEGYARGYALEGGASANNFDSFKAALEAAHKNKGKVKHITKTLRYGKKVYSLRKAGYLSASPKGEMSVKYSPDLKSEPRNGKGKEPAKKDEAGPADEPTSKAGKKKIIKKSPKMENLALKVGEKVDIKMKGEGKKKERVVKGEEKKGVKFPSAKKLTPKEDKKLTSKAGKARSAQAKRVVKAPPNPVIIVDSYEEPLPAQVVDKSVPQSKAEANFDTAAMLSDKAKEQLFKMDLGKTNDMELRGRRAMLEREIQFVDRVLRRKMGSVDFTRSMGGVLGRTYKPQLQKKLKEYLDRGGKEDAVSKKAQGLVKTLGRLEVESSY